MFPRPVSHSHVEPSLLVPSQDHDLLYSRSSEEMQVSGGCTGIECSQEEVSNSSAPSQSVRVEDSAVNQSEASESILAAGSIGFNGSQIDPTASVAVARSSDMPVEMVSHCFLGLEESALEPYPKRWTPSFKVEEDEKSQRDFVFEGNTWQGQPHGFGTLTYSNGSTYRGFLKFGKRSNAGEMTWSNGARYSGQWKDDLPEGEGTLVEPDGFTYSGCFRQGYFHGRGVLKNSAIDFQYEGEWTFGAREGVGRAQFEGGLVYEGEWQDNQPDGQGTFQDPSGAWYRGRVKRSLIDGQGEMVYPDGSRCFGEWKNGLLDGHAERVYPSGEKYAGQWKQGYAHGVGRFSRPDGSFYDGHWARGQKHGFGVYQAEDGGSYEGEWVCDAQEGFGRLVLPPGITYAGNWKNSLFHGHGHLQVLSSDESLLESYEGGWSNGLRSGEGKQTLGNGDVYEGSWKDNRCSGTGIYTSSKGAVYNGEWYEGLRHGRGRMEFAGGEVYSGDWVRGQREGEGILITPSQSAYEGQWKNDLRHGEGKMIWNTGTVYKGEWKEGERSGIGRLQYADGSVYEGGWLDGVREGLGTLTEANGVVYSGQWVEDRRCGHGEVVQPNGDRFVGEFRADCAHGPGVQWIAGERQPAKLWVMGSPYAGDTGKTPVPEARAEMKTLHLSDGSSYSGMVLHDMPHGIGTRISANGTIFKGEWAKGRPHGRGEEIQPDGCRLQLHWHHGAVQGRGRADHPKRGWMEGEWMTERGVPQLKQGRVDWIMEDGAHFIGDWSGTGPHGFGTMQFTNGRVYQGEWLHGEAEGVGTMRYASGRGYVGQFRKGIPTGQGEGLREDGIVIPELRLLWRLGLLLSREDVSFIARDARNEQTVNWPQLRRHLSKGQWGSILKEAEPGDLAILMEHWLASAAGGESEVQPCPQQWLDAADEVLPQRPELLSLFRKEGILAEPLQGLWARGIAMNREEREWAVLHQDCYQHATWQEMVRHWEMSAAEELVEQCGPIPLLQLLSGPLSRWPGRPSCWGDLLARVCTYSPQLLTAFREQGLLIEPLRFLWGHGLPMTRREVSEIFLGDQLQGVARHEWVVPLKSLAEARWGELIAEVGLKRMAEVLNRDSQPFKTWEEIPPVRKGRLVREKGSQRLVPAPLAGTIERAASPHEGGSKKKGMRQSALSQSEGDEREAAALGGGSASACLDPDSEAIAAEGLSRLECGQRCLAQIEALSNPERKVLANWVAHARAGWFGRERPTVQGGYLHAHVSCPGGALLVVFYQLDRRRRHMTLVDLHQNHPKEGWQPKSLDDQVIFGPLELDQRLQEIKQEPLQELVEVPSTAEIGRDEAQSALHETTKRELLGALRGRTLFALEPCEPDEQDRKFINRLWALAFPWLQHEEEPNVWHRVDMLQVGAGTFLSDLELGLGAAPSRAESSAELFAQLRHRLQEADTIIERFGLGEHQEDPTRSGYGSQTAVDPPCSHDPYRLLEALERVKQTVANWSLEQWCTGELPIPSESFKRTPGEWLQREAAVRHAAMLSSPSIQVWPTDGPVILSDLRSYLEEFAMKKIIQDRSQPARGDSWATL